MRTARARVALAAAGAACLWLVTREDEPPLWVATDREALARVIRSEIGSGSADERLHVAWAARNLAAERGQSIRRMACAPCGRQERGRPVSTRRAARASDRELAGRVLAAPSWADPT